MIGISHPLTHHNNASRSDLGGLLERNVPSSWLNFGYWDVMGRSALFDLLVECHCGVWRNVLTGKKLEVPFPTLGKHLFAGTPERKVRHQAGFSA